MAHTTQIALPGRPTPRQHALILEALTDANCRWYLDQWKRGREPPCCCKCGGVRYAPDRPGPTQLYDGAPQVFAKRKASCGSVAALEAGVRRAKAVRAGATMERAARDYWVEPEGAGPSSLHAVTMTPDGRLDATKKLEQAK